MMRESFLRGTVSCAMMLALALTLTPAESFAASKSPTPPKITKATVVNGNAVNLKWSMSTNAAKYKVYRKKADGKFVLVKTTTNKSFKNTKLAYGTKYTYKVTAVSKSGKTNTSKVKTVYTNPAKPVITASVVDNNSVKITWKKVSGAAKYKVYRKMADDKFILIKTTTEKAFTTKGLDYDTKYTFKVTAVSKAGKVNTSSLKSVVTGKKVVIEDAPNTPEKPTTPVEPETPDTPSVPDTPSTPVVQDCTTVGHNFQMTKICPPTCDIDGYNEYKCKRCGEIKTETTTAMLGHIWKVETTLDPTYTYEGAIWYRCERCYGSKKDVIPKLEQPAEPSTPSEPVTPSDPTPTEPTVPNQPEEPKPAERTVTVKTPQYHDGIVYWIKDIRTGEVLYKTSDPVAFEKELLTRENPETWHWGSGGVYIIVGYKERTYTESEFYYYEIDKHVEDPSTDMDGDGKTDYIIIWND